MNILRVMLTTIGIIVAAVSTLLSLGIFFAELAGPNLYAYTRGTVIATYVDQEQGSSALVRFTTRAGATMTVDVPNAFPHYDVGETLPIKYRPTFPTEAYNASFAANGLLGFLCLWLALLSLFLVIGPILFRRYLRRQVALTFRLSRS